MRACSVLILIGALQFVFGSSAAFTAAGRYGPSLPRFLAAEVLGGIAPLTIAIGAWQFRRTARRGFLWLATSGTALFALYAAMTTVDSIRSDTMLGLLWLLLPLTAVWMTAILWRQPL